MTFFAAFFKRSNIATMPAFICILTLFNTSQVFGAGYISPGVLQKSQSLRAQLQKDAQHPIHTWPHRNAAPASISGFTTPITQEPVSARLRGTNTLGAAEPLIQDLREQGQLQLSFGRFSSHTHLQIKGQIDVQSQTADDQSQDIAVTFDGSSAGFYLGNWDISAGAVDRWWGPAWQSPLLLSNNARPIPALSLDRLHAKPFSSTLLNWIGPWQINTFLGELESQRVIPNPLIWGFRFSAMPVPGLEFGLSRTALFGGQGRNPGPQDFFNVVTGNDNESDQPGNQLGSFDISYRFGSIQGDQLTGQEFYMEIAGEDEAGAFPAKKFSTLGFTGFIHNQVTNKAWHFLLEYSNTTAGSFDAESLPNITYQHHIYRTGYTHRGQFIGSPLKGDTESLTLGLWLDQSVQGSWPNLATPHHMGAWISKKDFALEGKLHQISLWYENKCWRFSCKTTVSGFDQPMKNQIIDADGDYLALSLDVIWSLE